MDNAHSPAGTASDFFSDERLGRYADVLWWSLETSRGTRLRRSDAVLVSYDPPALPLAEALFARLHDLGMNPVLRQRLSARMERDLYAKANNKRLTYRPPGEAPLYAGVAGEIVVLAPESLDHLSGADPRDIAMHRSARNPVRTIMARRQARGEFGRTVGVYPTPALAEAAGMGLGEYAEALTRACRLGGSTPVREWRRVAQEIQVIVDRLNGLAAREYRIESGTMDLRVTPGKKRRWLGVTGRNMPGYEIYLSPNWRGTEGTFTADVPSWRDGRLVAGARLAFRAGEVAEAAAGTGGDYLAGQLRLDRGSNKLGELSLTDRRFSPIDRYMAHTLLDENLGGRFGNCHIALGASHDESYAGNRARLNDDVRDLLGLNRSDLHWDLVNGGPKRVTAVLEDGGRKVVYEDGEFTV
jgi:aminopeptidase